jgi:hypothetical protein
MKGLDSLPKYRLKLWIHSRDFIDKPLIPKVGPKIYIHSKNSESFEQNYGARVIWIGPFLKNRGWGWRGGQFLENCKEVTLFI